MDVHLNTEWLNGFVKAVMEEQDCKIGPFLSDLSTYEATFEKCENESGDYKFKIPFQIIGDRRANLFALCFIRKALSTSELRAKTLFLCEEINSATIQFKRDKSEKLVEVCEK